MIKAQLKDSQGRDIALLGLTRDNVERLEIGHPLVVDLTELNMKGKVIIMFGETSGEILSSIRRMEPAVPDLDEPKSGEEPIRWERKED